MEKKMTSGEIAKKAGVTQKAVRLYDEKGMACADILALVQTESEDKSKTWKERKQHTIDALAHDSIETMQVCCADKLSNCRAQLYDFKQIGNALFDRFNKQSTPELQAWYYKSIVKALAPLKGMKMHEELSETVKELYGD